MPYVQSNEKIKYNGKTYKIQVGPRGGKYIELEGGKKKQIRRGGVNQPDKLSTISEETSLSSKKNSSKKSINPGVYDALVEHVSKQVGKTKSSVNKELLSLVTFSKGISDKSKYVQSKLKTDYDKRNLPIKTFAKELEEDAKFSRRFVWSQDDVNINFMLKRDFTKDIFESIKNDLRTYPDTPTKINTKRYTFETLNNESKKGILEFSLDINLSNSSVKIDSFEIKFHNRSNSFYSRQPTGNEISIYHTLVDYNSTIDRFEINDIILSNPKEEYIYVSIFTILGFLEFLLTTHKLDSLLNTAEKRKQFNEEVLEIKSKILEEFPNFLEGGMMSISRSKIPRTYKYSAELGRDIQEILIKGIDTIFDVCKDKITGLTVKDFSNAILILYDFNIKYRAVDKPVQDSCTCSSSGWSPLYDLSKPAKTIPSIHDKQTQYMLVCNFADFLYSNLESKATKTVKFDRSYYKNSVEEFIYKNKKHIQDIMTECNMGLADKLKDLRLRICSWHPMHDYLMQYVLKEEPLTISKRIVSEVDTSRTFVVPPTTRRFSAVQAEAIPQQQSLLTKAIRNPTPQSSSQRSSSSRYSSSRSSTSRSSSSRSQ